MIPDQQHLRLPYFNGFKEESRQEANWRAMDRTFNTLSGQWIYKRVGPLDKTGAITFDSIPQSGYDLTIEAQLRSTNASVTDYVFCRLNGDDAANYYDEYLLANSAASSVAGPTNRSHGFNFGEAPGASATASHAGAFTITFPNYTGTSFHKSGTNFSYSNDGTNSRAYMLGWIWLSTAAITKIELLTGTGTTAVWAAGSSATLTIGM